MSQLKQRLKSIQEQMTQLRNSGEIAPDNTWIQKFYVPKNGKRYEYYRLMKACERKSKTGKIQGQVEQYLGKLGSKLYKRFQAAIGRRNQLKKLQRIYQRLLALLESEKVSQGNKANSAHAAIIPKLTKLEKAISKSCEAIEQIQQNQQQLWYWLKLFGEKLGISSAETASTATS